MNQKVYGLHISKFKAMLEFTRGGNRDQTWLYILKKYRKELMKLMKLMKLFSKKGLLGIALGMLKIIVENANLNVVFIGLMILGIFWIGFNCHFKCKRLKSEVQLEITRLELKAETKIRKMELKAEMKIRKMELETEMKIRKMELEAETRQLERKKRKK